MSVREAINTKRSLGVGLAVFFLATAAGILIYTQLPTHHLKGDKAYFTDDDGQSWFLDSVYQTPPYDHNGKPAVRAMIYSYNHGEKTFCAYLMRFTTDSKKRLDDAIADAVKQGKTLSSVKLFDDRELNATGVEVKAIGSNQPWVGKSTPKGLDVMNQGLGVHADDTSDLVIAE